MNADLRKRQDDIRDKESRLQDLKRNLQDAENRAKEKMQLKVALEDSNRELVELRKTIDENDDKSRIYLTEFELKGVELNTLHQEIARDEQVLIEKLQFVQDGVHRINTSNQQLET
jgi:phosphate uptake regulator